MIKNSPGFFYVRYLLLFLFGIFALIVQSNNPKTLVYILGITWLIIGLITGLIFYIKTINKKSSLVYLIFVFVDLLIGFLLLLKSEYIASHFSKFIGIIAVFMSFTLLFYRSKSSSNKVLYTLTIFVFLFGISLFFDSFISDVFISYLIAIFFTIFGLVGILFTGRNHLNAIKKKN